MTYPGNPSLSPDVQAKTRATFEQTLGLVAQGRDQEALAGCEFILGLDPLFRPAQQLQARLRSQERPVKLDDLASADAARPPAGVPPAPARMEEDDLRDLQQRSLSLDSAGEDSLLDLGADDPIDVSSDSGLGDLEDLDDLDLDALPELDVAGSSASPVTPPVGAETLPFGAEPPALGEETLSFGDETVALGEEDALLEFGDEAASPTPDGLAFDSGGGEDDEEGGSERIAELLAEGQGVFEQGDYQGAIDVWSRIFLIDISNGQASQRIEEARKKKAELERQAEEVFHEGVAHIESGSLEEAKTAFRRVLAIDEGHSMAREYLGQLEAGKVPAIVSRSSDADLESLAADAAGRGEASPSLEAAVQRDRVVVVKRTDKRLIALAALVAVVVVGGGGYVFLNRDELFPNTTEAPPAAPARIDPILRATKLYESGETELALKALRDIPSPDPSYEEARALIDQWEAQIAAAQEEVDRGPSPELLERRNLLIKAARLAQNERRFLRARRYFERAHKILPLESEDRALMLNCEAELRPLSDEIARFEDREFAIILRGLWKKREEDPGDHDVDRLIVDSYYNLSLLDLQRGDAREAASKLKDALEVDPEDADLQRLQLFAETYSTRSQDLLYKIFIKYLPEREL